ncbi:MAG TPA: NUDIX hydrolase, partial [Nitrospira sp.]|nr:NUDIX hydrolase [Nitrospira sp.]
PRISQVHMVFRGSMRTPEFKPGTESLDVQLFSLEDIPWDDLAFPVITEALERYVADVARGTFSMHFGSVFPRMKS